MIDHITLKVNHFAQSVEFYAKALAPLGYVPDHRDDHAASFRSGGEDGSGEEIWIAGTDQPTVPIHLAFLADNADQVKAFHKAGLSAGGTDHGAPGPRNYHPGYYAAFVLDPSGNNIEAMLNDYEG